MRWKYNLSDIDIGIDEINSVARVVDSKWLSSGPITEKFEKRMAQFLRAEHVLALSSCTAALHLALLTLKIKEGDEVIVPSLTFVASANCILYVGATPVFADISGKDNFTICPEDIRKKITNKTRAILVVHYAGYPCDMQSILKIAQENDLYVIEDAAHAIGGMTNGKMLGTVGDVGCFSFFANKNLVTGEGGMIVSPNSDLIKKARSMRSHSMTTLSWDKERGHAFSYDVKGLGYNYRITEMQSAMGIVQLEKLKPNNERRKKLVKRYRENLKDAEQIQVPFENYEGTLSYHIFPALLSDRIKRNAFMQELKERGIQTSIHYPPVHLFSYYRSRFGCHEGMLPDTEYVAQHLVTLPLHPLLSIEDIDSICHCIFEILRTGHIYNLQLRTELNT